MSDRTTSQREYSSYNSSASMGGGDSYSGVFEPDVVLPSQFFGSASDGIIGGERRLMAALLSDGIESYISQSIAMLNHCGKKTDAVEWVETQDHSYVFSFDMVCESLGLDAEYLRLGLARYVATVHAKQQVGEIETVWKKIRRPRKQ